MANQQVKGNGGSMRVPTAARARNVPRNVENLFNSVLVDWAFEDASISGSKLTGFDAINVESLGTADVTIGNVLQSDGDGTLSFITPSGGAFAYTAGFGLYGTQNANTVTDTSVQIGVGAQANINIGGVAVGNLANAGAYYAVSIGDRSVATENRNTAVGYKAVATTSGYATAIGSYATATGLQSFATTLSRAYGSKAISMGASARAYGGYSISIGASSYVATAHTSSLAIGGGIITTGANQLKMGVSNVNSITLDTWTAAAAAAKASTHQIPVLLGGVRYNILVSNV